MTKKRDSIPDATLKRLRALQAAVERRTQEAEERSLIMPLTTSTVATIAQRAKDDPDFAAAVDAELQAMRIEQELVALRLASGLSQRQLAAKLGVKQPVIAKLEAGKTRNIGLQTLVRAVKAMNGRIDVSIKPAGRQARSGRKRTTGRRKMTGHGSSA